MDLSQLGLPMLRQRVKQLHNLHMPCIDGKVARPLAAIVTNKDQSSRGNQMRRYVHKPSLGCHMQCSLPRLVEVNNGYNRKPNSVTSYSR